MSYIVAMSMSVRGKPEASSDFGVTTTRYYKVPARALPTSLLYFSDLASGSLFLT